MVIQLKLVNENYPITLQLYYHILPFNDFLELFYNKTLILDKGKLDFSFHVHYGQID